MVNQALESWHTNAPSFISQVLDKERMRPDH